MYADNFGTFQLPRDVGHDIDGIGATNTDAQTAQTAAIRCVTVGANKQ
jgi:hypothetical protein